MNKIPISIYGFSNASGLLSLLLAENGISHKFNLLVDEQSFSQLPPISNPIVNFATQRIEKKFIDSECLENVIRINNYNFLWFDKNLKKTMQLTGKYKFPLYAIDNRIRYKFLLERINKNKLIKKEMFDTCKELIISDNSELNFIGGGSKLNYLFKNFEQNNYFKKAKVKKTLFYLNLIAPNEILKEYATSTAIYLEGNDYFIVYTSFHLSEKNVLTIVINSNIFDDCLNAFQTFENIKDYISLIDEKIAKDLKKCELIPEKYLFCPFESYFKEPTTNGNLVGLGETIFKVNPITGKGYNCSAEMMNQLTLMILKAQCSNDIIENYKLYASKKISELSHLDLAFTENQYNTIITPILIQSMNNKNLRDFVIAETYENTSLYFPWLINEKASKRLIQDFSEKKWYQSILWFLFQNKEDV
jgi:hypothetical protein